jgi:hypothetical protein
MKMKEHFTKMAAFHAACAKAHAACASAHQVMHEDSQKIAGGTYHNDLAQSHEALKEAHADAAEHCVSCARSFEGHDSGASISDIDVDSSVPTHANSGEGVKVSAPQSGNPWHRDYAKIVPTDARAVHAGMPANLQAVPRPGSPPIDTSKVPPEFAHLAEE